MKILNLFPLTVVQDSIMIEDKERNILIDEIKNMKFNSNQKNKSQYAWTGDTKGHEFLFSNNLFNNLASKISKSIPKTSL